MTKKKNAVGKSYEDRWGKPITVHCYLADNAGRIYMVNSHYQAVPQDEDAPAVMLEDLLKDNEVRVLTPEEVLRYVGNAHADSKPAEQPGADDDLKRKVAALRDDADAAVTVVLSGIPDTRLANELRRRGYHVTAVKPAIIEL